MNLNQAEVSSVSTTERDAALLEAAKKYHPHGKIAIVCGVIVEDGEPTGTVNLQVRNDAIDALAVQIKRQRAGR